MKLFYTSVLASIAATVASSCSEIGGNWYCSQTNKIIYQGVGFSGSYQDVTNMDEGSGACSKQEYAFSGSLSPLDEELSVHFRGPIQLLQFGVYYPSNQTNAKRDDEDAEPCSTTQQHAHHVHKRATHIDYQTQTIFVNAQGETVTSAAPAAAASTATGNANAPASPAATSKSQASGAASAASGSASGAAPAASGSASGSASGAYQRTSYFTPGSADNCVFLNNNGGRGSGVWSATFGSSLSYSNADCSDASTSPVALSNTVVGSDDEFIIFSGSQCSGNSCGYYRNGIPAYHGFGGSQKIFVFEFSMPTATTASSNNNDMPAVWLLNAKIPRTVQYSSCSCWGTGCGELDLFEVLSPGSTYMTSHLHSGQGSGTNTNNGGGASGDYFGRPVSGTFKAAVVFTGSEVHILEVTDDFGASLSQATVDGWIAQPGSVANLV